MMAKKHANLKVIGRITHEIGRITRLVAPVFSIAAVPATIRTAHQEYKVRESGRT